MLSRSYKYYWWCQFAGWGFVGLSLIFFAYTFNQPIDDEFRGRIGIIIVTGIITTHLLRWVIRRFNWLMLPIERVLPKLLDLETPSPFAPRNAVFTQVADGSAPDAFDRYKVQVAIVGPRSLLARRMRSAGEWQEVYQDEMAIVFSRRPSSE